MLEEEYRQKIKEFVIEHKIGLVVVIVIALFSLISQTWFRGNYTIGIGDSYFTIDSLKFLRTLNSSWRSDLNMGNPEFGLQFIFPYSLVYFSLNMLGFGVVASAKIWMYLTLFLPAVFMYLFLDMFFKKEVSHHIKLATSLFYVFNPVTMLTPFGASITKFPVHLAIPILSFLLLKIFRSKIWNKKFLWGIIFIITLGLSSAAFGNVAESVSLIIILAFLVLFELFLAKEKIKHLLLLLGMLFFSFSINSWWILSSFYSQYLTPADFLLTVTKPPPPQAHIFDAMRLFGFWALNLGDRGLLYLTFGPSYYKPLGVVASYIISILVFSSLIFINFVSEKRKYSKRVVLFIFLSLLSIFIVKGPRPPLGGAFVYMYNSYDFFKVFREPYSKFSVMTLFSFTVVLSFSLQSIASILKKHLKNSELLTGVSFIFLSVVIAYPMFTGEFVPDITNGPRKQMIVKTPQYWLDILEFSKRKNFTKRILTLPENSYFRKSFIWEKGFVGNPYNLYIEGDKIFVPDVVADGGDILITQIYGSIREFNVEGDEKQLVKFVNLARILNIGYLLQMNDFDWISYREEYADLSTEKMENFYLEVGEYFENYKSFGRFTPQYLSNIPHIRGGEGIYRLVDGPTGDDYLNSLSNKEALILFSLKDEYDIKEIYIPDIIDSFSETQGLLQALESERYLTKKPLLLINELPPAGYEASNISVEFEKISDSKYKVNLKKPLDKPTYLVFSTTYDSGWQLAKNCNWLRCQKVLGAKHIKANLYANGWLISPEDILQKNNLYIVHESETRLKIGVILSVISLVSLVILFFLLCLRMKKK